MEAALSTTDHAARHGSRRSVFSFWRRRTHREQPTVAEAAAPVEAVEPSEATEPVRPEPVRPELVPDAPAATAGPAPTSWPGLTDAPAEPVVAEAPPAAVSDGLSERAAVLEALSASLAPTVEERASEPAPEPAPAEPVTPFVTFRPAVDVLPQRGGGRRARKGRQAEPVAAAAPVVPVPVVPPA